MWELWTLNIFKIAKFESDTSEASDDISPQSCEFRSLYGEAHATFRSSIFESFQPITFKVSNFTNLKAFFLAEFKDFSPFVHAIKWKKKNSLERSIVALVMRCDTNGVKWTHKSKQKNSGESRGGRAWGSAPSFIFRPNNWGLKGSLPPLSQGLDDRRLAPHPLRFPLSEDLDLPLKSKCRSSALNKVTESFL